MDNLILLPKEELDMRLARIREAARLAGATGCILIADNATLYYLTGRVFLLPAAFRTMTQTLFPSQ